MVKVFRLLGALQRFSAIVACLTAALSARPGIGYDSEAFSPDQIKLELETRASQVQSGDFKWRVVRRLRSPDFGTAVRPEGNRQDHDSTYRVRFEGPNFRLDGRTIPNVRFGRLAFLSGGPSMAADEVAFRAALAQRFTKPHLLEPSQPFRAFLGRGQRLCCWDAEGESYARGCVFSGNATLDSISRIETSVMEMDLLEAMRLAIRPSLGERSQYHLLPHRPIVEGRRCVIIERAFGTDDSRGTQPRDKCRYWIDPVGGGLIVRFQLCGADGLVRWQCHLTYDRELDNRWLPFRVALLRTNRFGDPADQLVAERESGVLGARFPAATFNCDFPAGTCVSDQTTGRQFLVRSDLTRHPISASESLSDITYADLLKSVGSVGGSPLLEKARTTIYQLITWPGILLTLSGICGMALGVFHWTAPAKPTPEATPMNVK